MTHRMKYSKYPTDLYHHIALIRRPPVLFNHSRCLLCSLSEVGFQKDDTRTRVCIIPRKVLVHFCSGNGLPLAVTRPLLKRTSGFHPRDHHCAHELAKRWTSCKSLVLGISEAQTRTMKIFSMLSVGFATRRDLRSKKIPRARRDPQNVVGGHRPNVYSQIGSYCVCNTPTQEFNPMPTVRRLSRT